jgi:diaminopimelate epimerase
MRKRLADRTVTVTLPGGDLVIEWTPNNRILMTGPAVLEYEGRLEPDATASANA